TAMAVNPRTGKLYGVTAPGFVPPGGTNRSLCLINKDTGAATIIGTGNVGNFDIPDMHFAPDCTLYAWSEHSDALVRTDIHTGRGTVTATAASTKIGSGLAFDPVNQQFYLAGNGGSGVLRPVNTTTGLTTIGPSLSGSPAPGFPIPAMKFHPTTNVLYAIQKTAFPPNGASRLITIDKNTGAISNLGATLGRADALAFDYPTPNLVPPTITSIADQTIAQDTSATVPFNIAGGVILNALTRKSTSW